MQSFLRFLRKPRQAPLKDGTVAPSQLWEVYIDDNYHYMDSDKRYHLGSFESRDEAVAACRKIVDDFLSASAVKTADEVYQGYIGFGEDPWIKSPNSTPQHPRFSAWEYARQRCHELFSE